MPSARSAASRVITGDLRERAGSMAKRSATFLEPVKNGRITDGCEANSHIGTGLAVLPIPIGCARAPVPSSPFKHGGARNSASRTSDGLTLAQAEKLAKAAQTAMAIGRPLNRHICVHWEAAGLVDREAMPATTAFLKYLREWLRGQTAYLWTRENGDGKGSHVHILAHIPDDQKMNGALSRRWVERCIGRKYRAGAIFSRRIAGASQPTGVVYGENLSKVVAYVLKGVEPHVAKSMGISHEYGGDVIGKRCGTSRNLGAVRSGKTQKVA